METNTYRDEDTIDIKELLQTLKKKKKLIYLIVGISVALAILYAFILAKPVYEVNAMIEIGKIDAGTKNETPLDDVEDVKQKLEYLYGVHTKKKRNYPRVKAITVPKGSKSIFSLTIEGRDNISATSHINKIVHQVENSYEKKVETYIQTQKELILLTETDINNNEKNLKNLQDTLIDYHKKMLSITKKNAALAGLYTIQISQNQIQAQTLQSRISALKTKVFKLKLSIAPLRITQTHIVGNIEVLNKPIKPKKLLIVIVAFLSAILLSIFLVFFLSFIQKPEDKKDI